MHPQTARALARQIVDFWHGRRWLPAPAPMHVHPLDLAKLEDLIAEALADDAGEPHRVGSPAAPYG